MHASIKTGLLAASAVLVAASLPVSPASAAFITYQGDLTQETSWRAAAGAGAEPLETFDGFSPGTMIQTLPGLGVGFEAIAPGLYPGVYQHGVDNTPSDPRQLSNMPSGTPNSAYQFADIVLYVLPGFVVTAVGFWNGDPQAAMTGSVYDASNNLLGTFSASAPGTANFAGFTSDIAVHRIIFEGNVGDGYNHIDDLQTNAAHIAIGEVPEPMTLSLLGAGIAGIGWLRRRRALHAVVGAMAISGGLVPVLWWGDVAEAAVLDPFVHVGMEVTNPNVLGTTCSNYATQPTLTSVATSTGCSVGPLSGSAQAKVDVGSIALGNSALVTSTGAVSVRDISVVSRSAVVDNLTIRSPGRNGELGNIVYKFGVHGSFNFQNIASAAAATGQFIFTARQNNGNFGPDFVGSEDQLVVSNINDFFVDILTGPISTIDTVYVTPVLPFRFDEEFQLILESVAGVFFDNASSSAALVGSVDFFNTSTLVGLEIFDAGMNPITTFSLFSELGQTFPDLPTNNGGTAVPEPGTLAILLGAGLAGLGWVRRRRG